MMVDEPIKAGMRFVCMLCILGLATGGLAGW